MCMCVCVCVYTFLTNIFIKLMAMMMIITLITSIIASHHIYDVNYYFIFIIR